MQTPLMKAPTSYTYTIPSCLKKGFYLVRHEIIALHAAYAYPGAQFYPGCHQLNVTGSGSTVPSSLSAFPGAYKGTDAGITYDAYKGECSSSLPFDGGDKSCHGRLKKERLIVAVDSNDLYHSGTRCVHLLNREGYSW